MVTSPQVSWLFFKAVRAGLAVALIKQIRKSNLPPEIRTLIVRISPNYELVVPPATCPNPSDPKEPELWKSQGDVSLKSLHQASFC
jgi:hypothetical protein